MMQESSVNDLGVNECHSKNFLNSQSTDHFDSKQLEKLLNQAVEDDKLEVILPFVLDYLKDFTLETTLIHQTNLEADSNSMTSEPISKLE